MGPPPEGGGDELMAWPPPPVFSMLQWGRLPKEAETSSSPGSRSRRPGFNGAASRRRRRRPVAAAAHALDSRLQWGRLPKEAETKITMTGAATGRNASMGPPPEGGGDV